MLKKTMWNVILLAQELVAGNDHFDLASTPVAWDVGIITHNIDFRIQELPHSSVEEAGHVRVREQMKSDRTPSSPRWMTSRFDASQRLQPIQWEFEENDPRHGECGVLRIMRDHFKSTMLLLFVLLDKRHCVRHLWKLLVPHRIHTPAESKSIRCLIDFELCDLKGMPSRSSKNLRSRPCISKP